MIPATIIEIRTPRSANPSTSIYIRGLANVWEKPGPLEALVPVL